MVTFGSKKENIGSILDLFIYSLCFPFFCFSLFYSLQDLVTQGLSLGYPIYSCAAALKEMCLKRAVNRCPRTTSQTRKLILHGKYHVGTRNMLELYLLLHSALLQRPRCLLYGPLFLILLVKALTNQKVGKCHHTSSEYCASWQDAWPILSIFPCRSATTMTSLRCRHYGV